MLLWPWPFVHPSARRQTDPSGRTIFAIATPPVGKVDMVDIDGELIEICKDHLKCVASEGGA